MSEFENLTIMPLGKLHDRAAFSCGVERLDHYLQRQASQDIRRRIAQMFVCTRSQESQVLGFYTLSAIAVDVGSLPENLSRKLPRHPVPCALIGRLAVDQSAMGHGVGKMLLADAVKRTVRVSDEIAIHAMVVDAKDDSAKQFYRGFGFISLNDPPMRLFLPLKSITT
jgi:GNAT superfamily N-acetyltransferase